MKRRLVSVVAVMLSVGACSDNATPTSPTTSSSAVPPAGSWSGSIRDPISGEGAARLSFGNPAPNGLSGTWSVTFKSGDSFSGLAVAVLDPQSGYGIMLYVQPPPRCATGSGPETTLLGFTLINVVVTSSQLTAVSGRMACLGPGVSFGTVSLSKQ